MKKLFLGLLVVPVVLVLSESAQPNQSAQKAKNCSVNISGNGNSAFLSCSGIDVTLAKQIQAILNGTCRNENSIKDISGKLDRIIDQMNVDATPPDVALSFVYPNSPALMIVNQSGVVARDMKWAVELWNVDLPDRNDPLPIPWSSFDWLKGHSSGGPMNLFNSPSVSPLLKQGNHLLGSASVNCPTCDRGRTYIVSIEWGVGGWIAELENETSGTPVLPGNFSADSRKQYFETIEQLIPINKRIPIGSRRPQ